MVADNLAAHQIGGFQSTFSSGYFCRRCYIQHSDLNVPMSQIKPDVRTTINHDALIRQITSSINKSPIMGVVSQSPLHNLNGFHPTMALPADLMHDYLEGICPRVIISLLKEASTMRLITYRKSCISFANRCCKVNGKIPPICSLSVEVEIKLIC